MTICTKTREYWARFDFRLGEESIEKFIVLQTLLGGYLILMETIVEHGTGKVMERAVLKRYVSVISYLEACASIHQ